MDEDTVYITINVVRKSDGMVSPFMLRFGTKRPSITCELHFGSLMETPHILQPGSWTPAPDPAIVVRSDCVEIRRIHVTFRVHLENDTDQDGRKIWWGRKIDHDTLHRVLSARLRFA